jgi:hypothetical protein
MSDTPELTEHRISRREGLRRAAIIGGVAWSAPVLQTLSSAAYAQAYPGCEVIYCVKFEGITDTSPTATCVECGPAVTTGNCLASGGAANGCGRATAVVTPTTITVTLDPGCQCLEAEAKVGDPGGGCGGAGQVTCSGNTATATEEPGQGEGLSNFSVRFCCPN